MVFDGGHSFNEIFATMDSFLNGGDADQRTETLETSQSPYARILHLMSNDEERMELASKLTSALDETIDYRERLFA
jgi:hypothetical protein